MNELEYITRDTADQLAERLADDVVLCLQDGIEQRGKASLVVSGGSTPVPFFKVLRQRALEWSKVSVTLADERWVPDNHADSNAALVAEHLLQDAAAEASFVGLYVEGKDAFDAQPEVELRLQALMPFDAVVLSMGSDGHTASLFPYTEGLADALDLNLPYLCRAMNPETVTQVRMTLTLKAILSAQEIALHITGEEKRQVLEYATVDRLVEKAPVSALIIQDETPVSVYWSP